MSDFNSLFDIVRGRVEGTIITESLPAATGYESAPGDIVEVINDAGVPKFQVLTMPRLDNAASVAALALLLGNRKVGWVVDSGQRAAVDYSGSYVGKTVAARGAMQIKTDKFNTGDVYVPGTKVTVIAGIIRAQEYSGAGQAYQPYGEVIEVSTDDSYLIINVID